MAPASSAPETRAEVRLLGPFEVRVGGRPVTVSAAQQRVVLAALALRVGEPVTTDTLCDALWPEQVPSTARTSLHNTIRRLRLLLADAGAGEPLRTGPDGYRLDLPDGAVDAVAFTNGVTRARRLAAGGDEAAARSAYDEALGWWRGEPMQALVGAGWLAGPAEQLTELRLTATEEWSDLERAAGRPERALERLAPLAEAQPLREGLRARLMLAMQAAGRTADALAHYGAARRLLVEELGVEPGPALRAAHAEVLRLDEEASTADTAAPLVAPAQLPATGTSVVGRDDELALLDGALPEPTERPVVCVVSGAAGVGKTTLAARWAHRTASAFPDGQLWVDLRGFDAQGRPLTPGQVLERFLTAFGVAADDLPVDPDAAADLYRSLIADRRMLVVLDNARDAAQVRPLLPTGPGSLALVTSRHDLSSLAVTQGARLVSLDVLPDGPAERLLAERLGVARLRAEPAAVPEILARCGGLPLALALVAGRAAAQPRLPLLTLAEQLRDSSLDVLGLGDPATDLRAVLSWSLDALTPDTARAFALLGVHPGPEVDAAALASLAEVPVRQARTTLDELVRAHLAVPRGPHRVAMHDLVRDHARELARGLLTADERVDLVRRLADHYLRSAYAATRTLFTTPLPFALDPPVPGVVTETFADPEHGTAWLQAELPALARVLEAAAEVPGLADYPWRMARAVSGYLWDRCAWADIAHLHGLALRASLRASDRVGEADARHGLGDAYAGLGRFDEAGAELARSLDLYAAIGDVMGESDVRCTMGRMLELAGDAEGSIHHTGLALELYRQIGDRSGEAVALNNIGWMHSTLGDFEPALASCTAALDLYRADGDHAGVAYALDSMGRAYLGLGDLARAIECYAEAADSARAIGQHFNRAANLTHLGDARHANGEPDAARVAWRDALVLLEEIGHPRAESLRSRLALLGAGTASR